MNSVKMFKKHIFYVYCFFWYHWITREKLDVTYLKNTYESIENGILFKENRALSEYEGQKNY